MQHSLTLSAGQDRSSYRTAAWQRDAAGRRGPLIGPLRSVRKPTETAREIQRIGAREARARCQPESHHVQLWEVVMLFEIHLKYKFPFCY